MKQFKIEYWLCAQSDVLACEPEYLDFESSSLEPFFTQERFMELVDDEHDTVAIAGSSFLYSYCWCMLNHPSFVRAFESWQEDRAVDLYMRFVHGDETEVQFRVNGQRVTVSVDQEES